MTPRDSSRTRVILGTVAIIAVAVLVVIAVKWDRSGNTRDAAFANSEDSIPAMIQSVIRHIDAHEFPMALATVE